MILLVAATEAEMQPLRLRLEGLPAAVPMVSGVGPVQAAVTLTKYLATIDISFEGVINFGVCGAFLDTGLNLLDICLAYQETIGDLGICYEEEIAAFDSRTMPVQNEFDMNNELVARAEAVLQKEQIHYTSGNFVTVNCVSGTAKRGVHLRDTYQALCENMEGAAIASVCQSFALPCLEVRSVSNMVEDRDLARWKLTEACQKSAETVYILIRGLIG